MRTQVYHRVVTDPISRSDMTFEAWIVTNTAGDVAAEFSTRNGPGGGPHIFRGLALCQHLAWVQLDMWRAITRAIEAAGGSLRVDEPDPQLSLDDTPLTAGHEPTIKIGATH